MAVINKIKYPPATGLQQPMLCSYLQLQRTAGSGSLTKKFRTKEPLVRVISQTFKNQQFSCIKNQ
jgi:hypothetical protein